MTVDVTDVRPMSRDRRLATRHPLAQEFDGRIRSSMSRIYLDNAATSWPKPESVYKAVERYQREVGVAAGRSAYRDADEVHRIIARCRLGLANLIQARSANEIVFTQNCTDALNLAIHGLLQVGDHVVTTASDHNSVLRPLHKLQASGVQVTLAPADSAGIVDVDQLAGTVSQQSIRLLAINHVSNVTGIRQPIHEIASLAKEHGCLILLDAAQSIGHESIDVQGLGVDMLAAPGHKALMGPLGTGLLYIRESLQPVVDSIRQGGTGTQSELAEQPAMAPEKYESGNLNVPGIVGLDAGIAFVCQRELCQSQHLLELTQRTVDGLSGESAVTLYSRPNRYGIVSFTVRGFEPTELAAMLDGMGQIQVRAGLHCAPEMHRALGTFDSGGTVRISFGHFSKQSEVDTLMDALRMLIANPLH